MNSFHLMEHQLLATLPHILDLCVYPFCFTTIPLSLLSFFFSCMPDLALFIFLSFFFLLVFLFLGWLFWIHEDWAILKCDVHIYFQIIWFPRYLYGIQIWKKINHYTWLFRENFSLKQFFKWKSFLLSISYKFQW